MVAHAEKVSDEQVNADGKMLNPLPPLRIESTDENALALYDLFGINIIQAFNFDVDNPNNNIEAFFSILEKHMQEVIAQLPALITQGVIPFGDAQRLLSRISIRCRVNDEFTRSLVSENA